VINITTKSAKDTKAFIWKEVAGTELNGFTGVRYGGTLAPDVHYRIYGKYTDRSSATLTNGADAGDAWHTAQGGFRIDATTAPDPS